MLIGDLIASTILVGLTALSVWVGLGRSAAYKAAAGIATAVFLLSMMATHLLLAANAICLVALMSLFRPEKSRRFLASATLVTLFVYLVACCDGLLYLREAKRLRAEYSFESMGERLAYETRSGTTSDQVRSGLLTESAFHHEEFMYDVDGSDRSRPRAQALAHVHSSFVQQFIDAPGFGFARMPPPSHALIELPPGLPILLPARPSVDPSMSEVTELPQSLPQKTANDAEGGFATSARSLHRASYLDFVNSQGFGYILDRDHVAGFQPHQFREMPKLPAYDEKQRWAVEALDLVSLLKHSKPAAYVSDHLPRMDELRHAPVRPLDAFETIALEGLQGADIKISSAPEEIRMLGAIRATEQCLRCHNVDKDELLGAFSYRLRAVKQH